MDAVAGLCLAPLGLASAALYYRHREQRRQSAAKLLPNASQLPTPERALYDARRAESDPPVESCDGKSKFCLDQPVIQ